MFQDVAGRQPSGPHDCSQLPDRVAEVDAEVEVGLDIVLQI